MTGQRVRRLTLRDGGAVEVRPLRRRDRPGFAAAVARLSEDTLYQRFAAAKPRLSERELDFLVDIDHHTHEALLAIDPRTRDGVAVARYVQLTDEPEVVEVAVTVADEWQGRGLGGALVALLLERARAEGYAAARASTLVSNRRSIAMLRRGGFEPRSASGVLREYELALTGSVAHHAVVGALGG
jgi:GNAT superfamily N-acetyltransferase